MDVRRKKLKVTFFFLALIGFLIVTTSFYLYNQIQEHLGTANSPIHIVVNKIPFLPKQGVIGGINVAILQSGYTAEFFASQAKTREEADAARRNYLDISKFWRQQFAARRINADVLNDRQILTDLYRYNVLVLPLVQCMSDAQIEAVKGFVEANKGVILTHMTGNRDENGKERGWSLTQDITGGRPVFDLRLEEGSQFYQFNTIGVTPVSANIDPGAAINIASYDFPLRLHLREARAQPAAVWRPVDDFHTGDVREEAAIAFGNYLGGRFVWFGFTAGGVGPQRRNWERFDALIENAIQWASHRAVMSRMPWPDGRHAAVFAIKAERDAVRGAALERLFANRNIPVGMLLSVETLLINQLALQGMRDRVEFGLYSDLSAEAQKDGLDSAFEQRLVRGRNDFRNVLEVDVFSFNLPKRPEPGINHTLDKFVRMGYEYLWIQENQSYSPEIPPVYTQPLFRRLRTPVLLFESGDSSRLYPQLSPNRELSEARQQELLHSWIRGFEFTKGIKGLHTTVLPASLLANDRMLPLLDQFLGHVQDSGGWLAAPSDVARQWRDHESLSARIIESARQLTIIVSNDSNEQLPPFRLRIFPGRMPQSINIRAERIYVSLPEYTLNAREGYIDLVIEDLGSRENRLYFLELTLPRDR